MKTTSATYKALLADAEHVKLWKITIGGTSYFKENIVSVEISRKLYGKTLIGSACSAAATITLHGVASASIARMAQISIAEQLSGTIGSPPVSTASEWISKGTFWVNSRDYDAASGELTLSCVDGMMFGEQDFYAIDEAVTSWNNKTMREVAQMCASKMGLSLEDSSQFRNAAPYIISAPPLGYTVRQVLSGIAAAHSGNIIVTEGNAIRLVPFVPSDTNIDIGLNEASMMLGKQYPAFANVIFNFEATDGSTLSVRYPASEVSGGTMEATLLCVTDSTYATQIAQNVLSALGTYLYQPYTARDALIDPAHELGDALTIAGSLVVLGGINETCDALYSADVMANDFQEQDYEFIYQSSNEKKVERQIASSKASLSVRIDGISAMVQGLAPAWEANHSYALHDVVSYETKFYECTTAHTSESTFDSSKWSEISSGTIQTILDLAIGKMTLGVTSASGGSTIELTSGSVRITSAAAMFETNEAHFSGSLSADKISTGSLDADIITVRDAFAVQMYDDDNEQWVTVGYVGAASGNDGQSNTQGAMLISANGDSYAIVTNAGVRLQRGSTSFWLQDSGIYFRIAGGSITPIGYAVFS